MNALTRTRVQMAAAGGAIGYLVLLFLGWGAFAGFLPPTSPSATSTDIAALFASDHTRVRIGMVLVMFAAFVFIPFAAVAGQYIARIEGGAGILTYTLLLGGAGNMVLTFYPAIWWLTAAYRPDRGADQIYLVNDMAWLQFIGGATIFFAMPLALGIATLCDKSSQPVFPRWFGYANIWIILTVIPDQLLFFSTADRLPGTGCSACGSPLSHSAPSSSSALSCCDVRSSGTERRSMRVIVHASVRYLTQMASWPGLKELDRRVVGRFIMCERSFTKLDRPTSIDAMDVQQRDVPHHSTNRTAQ